MFEIGVGMIAASIIACLIASVLRVVLGLAGFRVWGEGQGLIGYRVLLVGVLAVPSKSLDVNANCGKQGTGENTRQECSEAVQESYR